MENIPPSSEPSGARAAPEVKILKRPWSVTLLALGVLIITVINLTRFVMSLRYWSFLASQPGISPLYLAVSGLVWAAAGCLLSWGLWRPKSWAPRLMEAVALAYALYYWLDLLFLKDHPVASAPGVIRAVLPTNWQFSAGLTMLSLGYITWTVGRAKVRAYFVQPGHAKEPGMVEDDGDSSTG